MTQLAKTSLKANEPPAPTRANSSTTPDRLPATRRLSNQALLRTLSVHDAATSLRREPAPEAAKSAALLNNLIGRAIEEIKHEKSYKVLVTIALVARKNHLLKPLANALNSIALANGNYLDAFAQTLLVEGGEGIHSIVVDLLAAEGVHREDSPQVLAMNSSERLQAAAFMGAPEVPAELLHQIVAALPWIAGLWLASHLVLLGDIVDLLGIAFLGQAAVQAVIELLDFYTLAKNARNESDLRAAGKHLATVVAIIGILGLGKIAKKYGSSINRSVRQLGRRAVSTVLAGTLKGTANAVPTLEPGSAPKVNISPAETRALQSAPPEPSGISAPPTSAIADRGFGAGLTLAEAQAAKQVITNLTAGRGLLGRIWERVTNRGEPESLTEANSRRLFNNQRRRFWSAVFDDREARALFERMGATFGKRGNAPVLRLPTGESLQLTVDHIIERQTDPARALDATNLRISSRLENTVLLRLIHHYDPFQNPPRQRTGESR